MKPLLDRKYHLIRTIDEIEVLAAVDPKTFEAECRFTPSGPYSRNKWKRIHREFSPWIKRILRKEGMPRSARLAMIAWVGGTCTVARLKPKFFSTSKSRLVKRHHFKSGDIDFTFAEHRFGGRSFYKAADVDNYLDRVQR